MEKKTETVSPKMNILLLTKELLAPFAGYVLAPVLEQAKTDPEMRVLGAFIGGHSAAALACTREGEVMTVHSLYVDELVRRNGIAAALLQAAAGMYAREGTPVTEVRTEYAVDAKELGAIEGFLKAMEFGKPVKSDPIFIIDTEKLHDVPVLGDAFLPDFKADLHVRSFSEITRAQLEDLEADESVLPVLKPSAMKRKILRRPSMIWVENGKVLGWVLLTESVDNGVVLGACCKREGAPAGSFRKMVVAAANRFYLMTGGDYLIYNSTITAHSEELTRRLTGGSCVEQAHYSARTGEKTPRWLREANKKSK